MLKGIRAEETPIEKRIIEGDKMVHYGAVFK